MFSNIVAAQNTKMTNSLTDSQRIEIKEFMKVLAAESSKCITPYFSPAVQVDVKSDNTPVTKADVEAEKLIRHLILEKFPDHGIIGEEYAETNPLARFKWVVDPIDGTKSFINGSYDFGTLIALLDNGNPIIGMYSHPILKEVIIGDGVTTECNGKAINVKEISSISECVLLITYISALEDAGCMELSKSAKLTKTWGNCFSYYLLAKGYPSIVVDPKMDIYDFMALIPIIRGAGGAITDISGKSPDIHSTSIVASSKAIHPQVIHILNQKPKKTISDLERINTMKFAIIIDGYSTGKNYARKFSELGYTCVHVQSSQALPQFILNELEADRYAHTLINEDLSTTINKIKQLGNPEIIVPGSDTGIVLADALAEYFELPTANVPSLSVARRDKYVMGETIRNAGIRAIKQTQSSNVDEALAWIEVEKLNYPIVVKPLKSGSGEGFSLCKNSEDVINSFNLHLGKPDLFNQINEFMLVQECIHGTEYVINTVSCNGKHYVSEICVHNKIITKAGHSIYVSTDFLPLNTNNADVLTEYMSKVLTALGVKYGPAHGEVFIDENGPVLVEVGCRPMGSSLDPQIVTDSYGHNHIDLAVTAYTDENKFHELCSNFSNAMHRYLSLAYMTSLEDGTVGRFDDQALRSLESFKKLDVYVKSGQKIIVARNLDDSICMLYLQHANREVLKNDIQKLRELERTHAVLVLEDKNVHDAVVSNVKKDSVESSKQVISIGLFGNVAATTSSTSSEEADNLDVFKDFLKLPRDEQVRSLQSLVNVLGNDGIELKINTKSGLLPR